MKYLENDNTVVFSYDPFGMITVGRSEQVKYRYLFEGQECSDELYGTLNIVDFKYRTYDSRLGRFLSIDPLYNKYPWNSVYAFCENRVIDGVDLEGLEYRYSVDGTYLGQGNDRSSCLVEIVSYETVDNKIVEHTSILTFNGMAISHDEFQQMGAIVYNETYQGDPNGVKVASDSKLMIADAIINMGDNINKLYPNLNKYSMVLQTVLDIVMYGKDSHEQRMSEKRQNPGRDDKIPGTKISLKNIITKHYAEFYSTSAEDRNKNAEMKATNKAVIDALRRCLLVPGDANKRSEDSANGKFRWRGNAKTGKNELK